MNDQHALLDETGEHMAGDLLSALLQEIKLMRDHWVKIGEHEQQEIIDRLRKRVTTNIRSAVHILASNHRTVLKGEVNSVTFKDGIKCVLEIAKSQAGRHELADAEGSTILIVLTDDEQYLTGADQVKPDPDQNALDLVERTLDDAMRRGPDDDPDDENDGPGAAPDQPDLV